MAFVDKASSFAALRPDLRSAGRRPVLGDDFLSTSALKRRFDGKDSLISARWKHGGPRWCYCAQRQMWGLGIWSESRLNEALNLICSSVRPNFFKTRVCVCLWMHVCVFSLCTLMTVSLKSTVSVTEAARTHLCLQKAPKCVCTRKNTDQILNVDASAALKAALFSLWCAFRRTLCNYFALCMLQAISSCMHGRRRLGFVTKYIYSSTILRYFHFTLLCSCAARHHCT